ncbi:MAG: hypothetical protein AAF564_03445 [Bacteroidota bacterium]
MDINQQEALYERYQINMFIGAIIGMTGMVASDVVESFSAGGGWVVAFSIVSLLGWGMFIVGVFQLRGLHQKRQGQLPSAVVDDERVQQNRTEAFSFAFMTVLVWLVVVTVGTSLLSKFTGYVLAADLAADVGIALGIAASLGRFIYLQRQ